MPKGLDQNLVEMAQSLDPTEQILDAVAGSWRHSRNCAVVLTSRQLMVGGGSVLQFFPLTSGIEATLLEKWRSGELTVRMQGQVADVKGIHLDEARAITQHIKTGVRLSTMPPGG